MELSPSNDNHIKCLKFYSCREDHTFDHIKKEMSTKKDTNYLTFCYYGEDKEISEEILYELYGMNSLEKLNFHWSVLRKIPEAIYDLTSLKELYLDCKYIDTMSPKISNLTNLTVLGISGNNFKYVPEAIFSLINLVELCAGRNPISELPSDICKLTKLKVLAIDSTNITTLPTEIVKLHLEYFDYTHTPIKDFSPIIEEWVQIIRMHKIKKRISKCMKEQDKKEKSDFNNSYCRINCVSGPNSQIQLKEKKLIIKESSIPGAGLGVFADEDIDACTIFAIDSDLKIFSEINDLAFNNNLDSYMSKENLDANINTIGYFEYFDRRALLMGQYKNFYLFNVKPLNKGDELSRFYDIDYWEKYVLGINLDTRIFNPHRDTFQECSIS